MDLCQVNFVLLRYSFNSNVDQICIQSITIQIRLTYMSDKKILIRTSRSRVLYAPPHSQPIPIHLSDTSQSQLPYYLLLLPSSQFGCYLDLRTFELNFDSSFDQFDSSCTQLFRRWHYTCGFMYTHYLKYWGLLFLHIHIIRPCITQTLPSTYLKNLQLRTKIRIFRPLYLLVLKFHFNGI